MPVYNGELYIKVAIGSILNQTFTNFELIIVNDGSTDNSVEIINSFKDSRIKLYHNDNNRGLTYSRNKCIEYAQGEYLAKLDCDDIALPTRLQEQVHFLETHPDFGLLGSWMQLIDEKGNFLNKIWKYKEPAEKIPPILLFTNYFSQSTVMIRKAALPEEWYRNAFPLAEDYDLWIRIAQKWKVWNLQKVLVYYRVHESNITKLKAEALKDSVAEILTWQLKNLGIELSQHNFAVHLSIARRNYPEDSQRLKDFNHYLDLLIAANSQTKIYTNVHLIQVINDYKIQMQHHFCNCIVSNPSITKLERTYLSSLLFCICYNVVGKIKIGLRRFIDEKK